MKKKLFAIIVLGLFLLGATGCGNANGNIGIYYHYRIGSAGGYGETLILNDDYSCIYEYSAHKYDNCNWAEKKESIEITYYDAGKDKTTEEARIVNNGLLMDNNLFEKIG